MILKKPTKGTRLLTLLLILSLLTVCLKTVANDELAKPQFRRSAPSGSVIEVDGVKYKAFTLDEWKEMAHLILDYGLLWRYSRSLETEIGSYQLQLELQTERVGIWEKAAAEQKSRGDILSTMFDKEHALRLKIEKQQRAMGWIPWAIVVVESIGIGILGVYSGAQLAASN